MADTSAATAAVPVTVEVPAGVLVTAFRMGRDAGHERTVRAVRRGPGARRSRRGGETQPGHADQPVVGMTWFEAGCLRGVARRSGRRRVEAAHRGGVGARGARRADRGAERLGPRAATGRSAGRSSRRALAGGPRDAEQLRPARHGNDRPRVVSRLAHRGRAAGEPRRLLAPPRPLVPPLEAEQPAARLPLRGLRLPRAAGSALSTGPRPDRGGRAARVTPVATAVGLRVAGIVEQRRQLDAAVTVLRESRRVRIARVEVRRGVVGREQHERFRNSSSAARASASAPRTRRVRLRLAAVAQDHLAQVDAAAVVAVGAVEPTPQSGRRSGTAS